MKHFIFMMSLFLYVGIAQGQELPTGIEIAKKSNAVSDGTQLTRALTMELTDKRGKVRKRETLGYRKYFGKEKRLAIFYKTPSSVKGTAFLVYDYPEPNRDDDQWLYIPALRKTRRISAANRGDYFLGTDLTYEDIKLEAKVSLEDFNYTTKGRENIGGHFCYVMEGLPVNNAIKKELGYSKIKVYVDTKLFMVRKTLYWDEAGNVLKTVTIEDIKQVQGIWTYHRIYVQNHKTKHQTLFTFSNLDYKTKIADEFFTEQALLRGI